MKRVGFVYDDVYLQHKAPYGHPENEERLVAILNRLKGSDIWNALVQIAPRRATFEELEVVHTKAHVEKMSRARGGYADPDTYISKGTFEAALHAAGGVLEAIDRFRGGRYRQGFLRRQASGTPRRGEPCPGLLHLQ